MKTPAPQGWGTACFPARAQQQHAHCPVPGCPSPEGRACLAPTSPTPVCTIFRPSSASSSAFTCSVDGEEMVRGVLPLHPRDLPRDRAKGYPRQLPTPHQLPSSANGTRMYGGSPLFLAPGKGHPTTGGGKGGRTRGTPAQLTSLAGHVCQREVLGVLPDAEGERRAHDTAKEGGRSVRPGSTDPLPTPNTAQFHLAPARGSCAWPGL